jgi:hypothetical protein
VATFLPERHAFFAGTLAHAFPGSAFRQVLTHFGGTLTCATGRQLPRVSVVWIWWLNYQLALNLRFSPGTPNPARGNLGCGSNEVPLRPLGLGIIRLIMVIVSHDPLYFLSLGAKT